MIDAQIVVVAKAPVAGRVKTRLVPSFTEEEAADLAAAALADTLDAVLGAPVARRVLALDGEPGAWLPAGMDVIGQRGRGLDERLANSAEDAYRSLRVPVLLIGMDTPQINSALLADAARPLAADEADATYGPASDGGYWLLGLRQPDPALILGVPMSRPNTGTAQLARLSEYGLRVGMLPVLTDVDTAEDVRRVAARAPQSRFAMTLMAMGGR